MKKKLLLLSLMNLLVTKSLLGEAKTLTGLTLGPRNFRFTDKIVDGFSPNKAYNLEGGISSGIRILFPINGEGFSFISVNWDHRKIENKYDDVTYKSDFEYFDLGILVREFSDGYKGFKPLFALSFAFLDFGILEKESNNRISRHRAYSDIIPKYTVGSTYRYSDRWSSDFTIEWYSTRSSYIKEQINWMITFDYTIKPSDYIEKKTKSSF